MARKYKQEVYMEPQGRGCGPWVVIGIIVVVALLFLM